MVRAFRHLAPLQHQLRFGHRIEAPMQRLASLGLSFLGDLYRRAGPQMHGRAANCAV